MLTRRDSLDSSLLEGTAPVTTPELTLRSFQLTRASSRAALAASLEDALATAPARRRRSASAAPLASNAIASARPELEELARALREERVGAARGVILARRLLTDGSGPLYVESGDGLLRNAAAAALSGLADHV